MAKKKPRPHVGALDDPESLSVLAAAWILDLETRNYSPATVHTRRRAMWWFLAWCEERALARASEITRAMLTAYQHALFQHRKPDGNALSFATQNDRLSAVKLFFQWLTRKNLLVYNPASEIELPRVEWRLPRNVLTAEEADLVISQPDVNDALGLRDRALLEVLYSTGMRRAEVCGLDVFDVDGDRGTVLIRQGKGRKDRVVPIGERASRWLAKYLADVRPALSPLATQHAMFVSHLGERLDPDVLSRMVRGYVEKAAIQKSGSCHLFRHAAATLMLENGADIRFIQQMLGHRSLETTEIYTHVSIRKLKEIHAATHPSAKWAPAAPREASEEIKTPRTKEGEIDRRYHRRRDELNRLSSLAAETAEEESNEL
jgi:integrase/recombinase XerD